MAGYGAVYTPPSNRADQGVVESNGSLVVEGTLLGDQVTIETDGSLAGSGMVEADHVFVFGTVSPGASDTPPLGAGLMGLPEGPGLAAPVTEPGGLALVAAGLAALAAGWRRRRRRCG